MEQAARKARQDLAEAERVLLAHRFERVNGTCGWTWNPPLGPVPDFVKIERLEQELAKYKAHESSFLSTILELQKRLAAAEEGRCVATEVDRLTKERDSVVVELIWTREARDKVVAELAEANKELTRLKSFACGDVLTHEANFALQNLNQLRKEHDLLKEELAKVKRERDDGIAGSRELLALAQSRAKDWERRHDEEETIRREALKDRDLMEQELAKVKKERDSLHRSIAHLDTDREGDRAKIAELQDALDSNKHDYEVNQQEMTRIARERDVAQQALDEAKKMVEAQRVEILRWQEKTKGLEQEAKRWEAKWHEEAEKYLKAVVPRTGPTDYDLTKANDRIASLERQLGTEMGICEAIKKERDAFKCKAVVCTDDTTPLSPNRCLGYYAPVLSNTVAPYLVWCATKDYPKVQHKSLDEALEEANRLAKKHPGAYFHVMGMVAMVNGSVSVRVVSALEQQGGGK